MTHLIAILRTTLAVLLLTAVAAIAQDDPVNLDDWNAVAQRAEAAVDADAASTRALEDLRSSIADFRDRLLQQQDAGDPRLETLQSQLEALGPVPENGEEPEDIATRRTELESQIAELEVPLLRVEEAYNRADGLIREIDEIIRTRQTDVLLERGAEPIDPRLWPDAFRDLTDTVRVVGSEAGANWDKSFRRTQFYNDLPAILTMLALALVLVFRAPTWIGHLGEWLRTNTRRGTGLWRTMVSLRNVVLPFIGLVLVAQAADVSGLFGRVGMELAHGLPGAVLVFALTRWIGAEVFSAEDEVRAFSLPQAARNTARDYVGLLSYFLALGAILVTLSEAGRWSDETRSVLGLPLDAVCGFILFRLGQILQKAGVASDATGVGSAPPSLPFHYRLARLVGQAAMVFGVLGPLLHAIGYLTVGQVLIYAMLLTLGLFGVMLILQRLFRDVFHLITGSALDESQSLLPVISGTLLTFVSLPLLALIWGARVTDLTELWAQFLAGFTFGDTRIAPSDFLTFVVVFVIGYLFTRLLQGGLRGSVLPKTRLDQGARTAIISGTGYLGIFLSGLVAITTAGIDLTPLAFVAGALSVGIGFGLQNIVQNFVSGIILLIERPISEGDWIEVNGQHGTVREISVRSTRIETFDRTDVIVPNGDLVSNSVTNYTRGNVIGRLIVDVGVAYGSDTRKVEDILYKIARNHDMVLMNPAPFVHFKGFGADSLDFDVRMILRDVTQVLAVRTEVNHQIAEAFAKEGIEIPFAQRDIWLRNPEALTRPGDPPSGPEQEDPST